jgi:hypothetical protein
MRWVVEIEPEREDDDGPVTTSIVDADDKDAAIAEAERDYRWRYAEIRRIRIQARRVRPTA